MKHKNDTVNPIKILCNFLWGLLNRNYLLHVKFLWGLLNVYLSLVSLADSEWQTCCDLYQTVHTAVLSTADWLERG
jgi:hypothetical protein